MSIAGHTRRFHNVIVMFLMTFKHENNVCRTNRVHCTPHSSECRTHMPYTFFGHKCGEKKTAYFRMITVRLEEPTHLNMWANWTCTARRLSLLLFVGHVRSPNVHVVALFCPQSYHLSAPPKRPQRLPNTLIRRYPQRISEPPSKPVSLF